MYRSFRPPNGIAPDTFFKSQLDLINGALCCNSYVMGDFSLDVRMSDRNDYQRKAPLELLNNFSLANDLIQVVNFTTWCRIINGTKKESTLDHVYASNLNIISNVNFVTPTFGDHVLVMINVTTKPLETSKTEIRRNWLNYTPQLMSSTLKMELDQCASIYDHADLNVSDFEVTKGTANHG